MRERIAVKYGIQGEFCVLNNMFSVPFVLTHPVCMCYHDIEQMFGFL